jgi:hypothetical protein
VGDNSCLFPGNPCDDGNPNTINDVFNASCVCEGTTVGVDEINAETGLVVYPNPGSQQVQISFMAQSNQKVMLKVFNGMGALVMNQSLSNVRSGNNSMMMDMDQLSSGVYTFQVSVENEVYQVRWIKK